MNYVPFRYFWKNLTLKPLTKQLQYISGYLSINPLGGYSISPFQESPTGHSPIRQEQTKFHEAEFTKTFSEVQRFVADITVPLSLVQSYTAL